MTCDERPGNWRLARNFVTNTGNQKMSEGTNKKQLSLRIIIAAVAFGMGFFAGREHLKSEIRNSLIEATAQLAEELDEPFLGTTPIVVERSEISSVKGVEESLLVLMYCQSDSEERRTLGRVVESQPLLGARFLEVDVQISSQIVKPISDGATAHGEAWFFFVCSDDTQVDIDMVSTDIDPLLVLARGIDKDTFEPITEDDDSGNAFLDARISAILPIGVYKIGAYAHPDGRNTGTYTLSVKEETE